MQVDLNKDIPKKFQPLLLDQSRFLILKGSAGSGKSVFVTKKVVLRAIQEKKHRFLMLRKVRNTVKESLFEETEKRISEWGLRNRMYYNSNKTDLKIWLGDSQFLFNGLDDRERIKSITGITGIVMEEMTEFEEEDFDQVNLRLRGNLPHYKQTIGMFNPIEETHWVKRRFFDNTDSFTRTNESTYRDNPFLDEDYKNLLESYKNTNPLYHEVYCLGNWGVVDKTGKFLHKFDRDLNIGETTIDEREPLKISFDFNIDPFAVCIYQSGDDWHHTHDEIRLDNSDIYQMCDHLKSNYPQNKYFYIVTGDRTGYNQTGTKRGKTSYWAIIREELSLHDNQIRLRSKNLDLVESRVLCNAAYSVYDIVINPRCKNLIEQVQYASVDDKGVLIKDRSKNKNDFVDVHRYSLDESFPDLTRNPKKRLG